MSKVVYDISESSTPLSTGYALTFIVGKQSELKAYITDANGDTVIDSANYTLSSDTEGVVATLLTFATAYTFPEGATRLTLTREVEITQDINLSNGERINADTLEEGLDNNCRISLMLAERLKRTVKMSISEEEEAPTFPGAKDRAGKILAFDENGNFDPVLTSDVEQKLAEALAAEEAALGYKTDAANSAATATTKAKEAAGSAATALFAKNSATDRAADAAASAATATEKETSVNAIYAKAVEVQTKVAGYESTFDTTYEKMQKEASTAATSATNAAKSEANAATSEANAKASQNAAKKSEINAEESAVYANQKSIEAQTSADNAETSANEAAASELNAKSSETTAKGYMENAASSDSHATLMAAEAEASANSALDSRDKAQANVDRLEGDLSSSVDNARQTVQGYIEEADESESRITALRTQLQTLVDKVESLSAQTVTETIIVDGSKVYKKSVTIKNGRPYCTLTEVTE